MTGILSPGCMFALTRYFVSWSAAMTNAAINRKKVFFIASLSISYMYGKDEKEKKEKPDRSKDVPPAELLVSMKKDIDSFAGSAPQFDDITMMIYYKGSK
jgi:hypothetical protein